jgi:hypothetical protein
MLKAIGPAEVPGSNDGYVVRPELLECVARIWQIGTTRETIPMLKLDARLTPATIESRTLATALRPFDGAVRKLAIYLEHNRKRTGMPDWSVGDLTIDTESASLFLDGLFDHRIGPVIGALMGTPNGRIDLSVNIIPTSIEAARLQFAVTDFDLGVKSRIS